MNKFIIKMIILLLPFILLSINYSFYEISGGDLNRIGKISVEKNYRKIFQADFSNKKLFFNLSDINFTKKNKANILTIGDSFSQQDNYGYQNYLSKMYNLNVINIDIKKYAIDNQIQMLFSITNGDLLNNLKVKYIILQCVERKFVTKGKNININRISNIKEFNEKYRVNEKKSNQEESLGLGILQDITKYFYYNILYKFSENGYISQVYKMKLNKKLFSTKENELLVYNEDIENIKYSTKENIKALNLELNILSNKLKNKNIQLIVLPSPDKFDIYYDFISNKKITNNNFFNYMDEEKKDYLYINSKKILQKHIINGEENIYFADDTHWSPIASKIMAEEIFKNLNITH